MAIFRKILLFAAALGISIAAYLGYRFYSNPPAIEVGRGYKIVKVEPGQNTEQSEGKIGDTIIGQTDISEFNLLDAAGNVKSRFGFKKLVHSEGFEWQLEEPYVNIYDSGYNCNVVSKSGLIRIEMIAGKPVPVSAKLTDSVVISFKTRDGGRDCRIDLEQLNYDIERNRFESNGKVAVKAEDMEMNGTGMTLIYNPDNDRIEMLKINELDFIKITETRLKSETSQDAFAKAQQGKAGAGDASGVYYEFILDNNVKVVTESDSINASSVRISNILWDDKGPAEATAPKESAAADKTPPTSSSDGFKYWQPEDKTAPKAPSQTAAAESDYETITRLYVTCDGGLVLRPHKPQAQNGIIQRSLDIIGEPVSITSQQFTAKSPYLWCGMDDKTLRLFSQGKGDVVLTTTDGKGSLEASDSVFWNNAQQTATVKGPGVINIVSGEDAEYPDAAVRFKDTLFMKMAGSNISEIRVKGGFDADMAGDNAASVSSNEALLVFEGDNQLSTINLSNNVKVSSPQGGVTADMVDIAFKQSDDGRPQPQTAIASGNAKLLGGGQSAGYHPVLNADKINYNFVDESATASGNIELTFSVPASQQTGDTTVPMVINADRDVVYRAAEGYIEFNDNVRGVSLTKRRYYSEQAEFQCDKLMVYLDNSKADSATPGTLRRLVLEGEKVVFEDKRFTATEVVSIVNLECSGFEYDFEKGLMTAAGPGNIKVNNRNVRGQSSDSEVSLGGPCYALIEDFSLLTIDTLAQKITADGDGKMVHIGYVPILADGKTGTQRLIDAGRIVIDYQRLPDGASKISAVKATGKVYYYEPDKYQLIGDNLTYDAATSLVRILGTPSNPCVLNSTLVEAIEYNILTGGIKTTISGVSTVPVN